MVQLNVSTSTDDSFVSENGGLDRINADYG